jgi:hypothetical protein
MDQSAALGLVVGSALIIYSDCLAKIMLRIYRIDRNNSMFYRQLHRTRLSFWLFGTLIIVWVMRSVTTSPK